MRHSEIKNQNKKPTLRWSSAFKIVLLLLIIMGFMIAGSLGGFIISTITQSPDIHPKDFKNQIQETSEVFDQEGNSMSKLVQNQFSEYVPIDEIAESTKDAVIAIEDTRFYQHHGIDFRRLARSMFENVKSGSFSQGGSTITMQLAKNLYTTQEKSVERKILDMYYALQIEDQLSKDEILEAYLNSAAFSKGTIGVQAAARQFFNKNASELTLPESAMIVGITNRPTAYTPYFIAPIEDNDDFNQIDTVLAYADSVGEKVTEKDREIGNKMADANIIDTFDAQQIQAGVLLPRKAVPNPASKERQELILYRMATLGMISPETRDSAISEDIDLELPKKTLQGISTYYIDAVKEEAIDILLSLDYSQEEAQQLLYNGGFKIYTNFDRNIQQKLEVRVNDDSYFPGIYYDEDGIVQPQVGSVIMDQHKGAVVALVGGRGIGGDNILNRAKNPRQPGSAIKPISPYLTSFEEHNGTAGDVYRDLPITSGKYQPKNSTGYRGYTTVRTLLVNSSNVGAYLVGKSLDKDEDKACYEMVDTLKKLGVTSVVTPDINPVTNDVNFSSLCLGGMTYGISPLEMAGAFATLANEGEFNQPYFIEKIENRNGEVIYKHKSEPRTVTSPQNAFILTNILEDVVERGTGRYANISGMHEAGKTGTTNDKKDSWFVGYTPYYTASVWIGNDDSTPLRDHSRMAARLWSAVMSDVHKDLDDKKFEEPDGIYRKMVGGYYEYFADNTSPANTKDLLKNLPPKPKKEEKKEENQNNTENNGNGQKQNTQQNQSTQQGQGQ